MTATASLALVVGLALAACSGGTDDRTSEATPSDAPSDGAEPIPSEPADPDDPKSEPSAEPAPEPSPDPDALPPGFPDPGSLIGQPSYDERSADGSWHVVVGGTALDLTIGLSACLDGGAGDTCAHSISSSVPAGPDGMPAPAEAALLLLLRSTGHEADGTPTWEVLDALVTRPTGDAPALLEVCEGAPGVAIYPHPDVAATDTVPVAAAWGPNADVTALVEVDPASITCAYVGP